MKSLYCTSMKKTQRVQNLNSCMRCYIMMLFTVMANTDIVAFIPERRQACV